MLIESLRTVVKAKKFAPVIFIFGEEEFMVDEAYHAITGAVAESGIDEFNRDVIDGDEASPEHIVQLASAFPMMSERRFLAVKRFDKVVSGRRTKNIEQSPLGRYFLNPSPSTILLLTVSEQRAVADELKGIAALISNPKQQDKAKSKISKLKFPYNLLLQHADWIEFPKLYERELPSWITTRMKERGRDISPEACEYIIAQVGSSLRDIANEIEKIITFVQDKKKITAADVTNLVGASRVYNVFELQKAVGERNLAKSLDIVQNMLRYDKQELLIISMLTRFFTVLWKLLDSSRLSTNHYDLAKTLGVSSFFIPEYLAVLQRYKPHEIENAFLALHTADVRIKSSSADTLILLQQMLIAIIGE